MVAALKTLRSPPSDHYSVLHLEPMSSSSAVRRQYETLTLTLRRNDDDSLPPFPGSEKALNRITASFQFLSDRRRKRELDIRLRLAFAARAAAEAAASALPAPVDTFWTACSTCRLLHEFERRYLGQQLICPQCCKSFLAVEVPPKQESASKCGGSARGEEPQCRITAPRSRSTSRPRVLTGWSAAGDRKRNSRLPNPPSTKKSKSKNEKTLAEIQMEIAKARKKAKDPLIKQEEDEDAIVSAERETSNLTLMAVEDSDFYDFDKDRTEKCFRKGQVWAVYDDDDGMPRHYGLIDDVCSSNMFKVKMSWLDIDSNGNSTLKHVSCGHFKLGKKDEVDSVNMFSHLVYSERAAREVYRIYPRKGSVWALYKEASLEGQEGRSYDIILLLTTYNDFYGMSTIYLEKVDGFKTIFTRREIGSHTVKFMEKHEFGSFSHQIPARKLSGIEGIKFLGDCWELDPASLPADLLRINWKS